MKTLQEFVIWPHFLFQMLEGCHGLHKVLMCFECKYLTRIYQSLENSENVQQVNLLCSCQWVLAKFNIFVNLSPQQEAYQNHPLRNYIEIFNIIS